MALPVSTAAGVDPRTAQSILALLARHDHTLDARVEGTGGNCTAIVVSRVGQTYPQVMLTNGDASIPDDESSILITYHTDTDAEPQAFMVDACRCVQAVAKVCALLR